MINLTEKQKQWVAFLLITLLTAATSIFLGVNYPLPLPPVEVDDEIVPLGTTHFTNIQAEDVTATDDLAVTDDATIGGDCTVTGDILGNTNVISKATSYTLLAAESGSLVTNIGAAAGYTFTLPAAAAGLNYCFYLGVTQIVTITPASGDQILHLTNAATNRITNTVLGDSLCLTCVDTQYWVPLSETGNWNDIN